MALNTPFAINIEQSTLNNNYYRNVIWTGSNIQLVLMSLLPGEVIDMEIHNDIDQFIRIEKGNMRALISKDGITFDEYILKDNDIIIIPRQHYHQIENIGNEDLKLYSIYGPPNHPFNRLQLNKPSND